MKKAVRLLFFCVTIFMGVTGVFAVSSTIATQSVYATEVVLRPSADPATSVWTPKGLTNRYSILANITPTAGQFICRTPVGNSTEYYELTNAPVDQGATRVTLTTNSAADYKFLSSNVPYIVRGVVVDGVLVGSPYKLAPPGSGLVSTTGCSSIGNVDNWPWTTTTTTAWTPSAGTVWSQAQIDAMKLLLGAETKGDDRSMAIRQYYATVTYDANPRIVTTQTNVFQDSSSTTPGPSLAEGYNKPGQLTYRGQKFRLRLTALNNNGADKWGAGYGAVKLQYAKKTAATCSAQSSGWNDVTSTSPVIHFYDNPNISDGETISYAGDPIIFGAVKPQQYRESNNGLLINGLASMENYAGWDFSLEETSAGYGGVYCFKLAGIAPVADITNQYHQPAEVRLYPEPLNVDVVDDLGNSIVAPAVYFNDVLNRGMCQTSSATFGSAAQKLRIINGTAAGNWSVTVAAQGGQSAAWVSGTGAQYDYDDAGSLNNGCDDGTDGDTLAGQLSVLPSSSVLTPSEGCANTGLVRGQDAAFSSGVHAVTLLSGSAASQLYCAWDMTGIRFRQSIPPDAPMGSYTFDLTVTATAS